MGSAQKDQRVVWFDDPLAKDIRLVGGKNAALADMIQGLGGQGLRFPRGFIVSAAAYRGFLNENEVGPKISKILSSFDETQMEHLPVIGEEIRHLIMKATFSDDLKEDIREAYHMLCRSVGASDLDVAVRSSATAEDLPEASFAGQQESYLNVRGDDALLVSIQRCFASLYTDRAISYRMHHGFVSHDLAISVGVQEMIRSDLASSGVMFTLDTESGFRDVILISASFGLGEAIVKGLVNPDEYTVFKPTLGVSPCPILRRKKGQKFCKIVYDPENHGGTKTIETSTVEQETFALSDSEILGLSVWGKIIEAYFSSRLDRLTPMDIEWAKDGRSGDFFILQARPETVHSQELLLGKGSHSEATSIDLYSLPQKSEVLLEGVAVGEKIAVGTVRIIEDVKDLTCLKPGEILVTDKTDPDWEPSMRVASGIITNRGGRTCHAAIVSRELGLPAIVGTKMGTSTLKEGDQITLSCAEGDVGKVYAGALAIEKSRVEIAEETSPLTAIMLNVANPDEAFHLAKLPNDGVGLARIEFIIAHSIKIHPMALLANPKDLDPEVGDKIAELTKGYADRGQYFVDLLAEGVGVIAAAFYPRPVIVRFSDFKTDEYANLLGGSSYEPHESNPMMGFRGASRYYSDVYRLGFGLECQAIVKVRRDMGLTNVAVMIPFCRTVDEGRKVIGEMRKHGLNRGEDGLLIYCMCEVPSNVILAHEFAAIFDGFSIGSNDLTQLTLGVDRDSELLAPLFDERNEAVTSLIASVIKAAHKHDMPIGICGQAPSDYPDFAAFLVHQGIDSISLNPDVAVKMRREIVRIEKSIELIGEPSEEHPHVRVTGHRKLRGRHRWKTTIPYFTFHTRVDSTH